MLKVRLLVAVLAFGALAVGCSDSKSGPAGDDLKGQLQGVWQATKAKESGKDVKLDEDNTLFMDFTGDELSVTSIGNVSVTTSCAVRSYKISGHDVQVPEEHGCKATTMSVEVSGNHMKAKWDENDVELDRIDDKKLSDQLAKGAFVPPNMKKRIAKPATPDGKANPVPPVAPAVPGQEEGQGANPAPQTGGVTLPMTGGNEALEKRVKELQAQYPNPTEEQQKLILEELMKLNHGAGEGVVPGDGEVKIEIEKD